MEEFKCGCCKSERFSLLYEGKDRLHGLPGDFQLLVCNNCGVISVWPQLSNNEIEKFYPENYISYPTPIENEKSFIRKFDRQYGVRKRRRIIERHTRKHSGRILDVGCATGVFLNEMKTHGWAAYGVEPSEFAAEIAETQLGLNVFNGYLDETSFEEHYFDVITFWDVFEHLPDPDGTLRIIKRILKPDGILVITMPNTDSWERKIFKQYWAGWDVPRHYHIFSKSGIERMFFEHEMRIDSFISFTGMLGAIRISLDFWIDESGLSEKNKRIIKNIYYSAIFRFLLYPYTIVSNMLARSTSMTIFASNNPTGKK